MLTNCGNEEVDAPVKSKRLDFYTDTFEAQDQGLQTPTKVKYEYNASNKLIEYSVYTSDPTSHSLVVLRSFKLFYTNDLVTEAKGYFSNSPNPYVEYTYQYQPDARVSKISANNHQVGLTSEAKFTYDDVTQITQVSYQYSNGESFEYEFKQTAENIVSDKTTKASELCSSGVYTYDQHVNPFKNLGYVDYELNNLSANNKLTEDVSYTGCAFPSLVPKSYSYVYDDDGYPSVVITSYTNPNIKQIRVYFYK
jgi:hypothetical protein